MSFEPVTPYKRKGKIIKGCWQLNFYFELPDGTMYRKREKCRLSSKSAANDAWKKREVELYKELTKPKSEQELLGPKLEAIWPDYIEHCRGQKQKPATIENKQWYWNVWLSSLKDLHLSHIDNTRISKLRSAMTDRKPSTVNNVIYALTGCMKYALTDAKVITSIPFKVERLKRTKVTRGFYEPGQIGEMWKTASPGERVMLLLGSHGGMRAGEIAGLEKADINLALGILTVRRAVRRNVVGKPKNNQEREIALSKTLAAELEAYMAANPEGARVLYQDNGRPMTYRVLQTWMRRCCVRAGLPSNGHMHLLRHSFITNLGAESKVAPRVIMDLAGHQSLDVTLGYMHLHRHAAKAAVQSLDGFGSGSAAPATPLLN